MFYNDHEGCISDGKSTTGEDFLVLTTVKSHLSKGRLSIVKKGLSRIHPMDVGCKIMRSACMLDS